MIEYRPVRERGDAGKIQCYDIFIDGVWHGSRSSLEAIEQGHWFAQSPKKISEKLGLSISVDNLQRIESIIESHPEPIRFWDYIYTLCGEPADKYLHVFFGDVSRLAGEKAPYEAISAIRLRTFIDHVLATGAKKEIWIPILEEYIQMGYYPLPDQWDQKILDSYEWTIQEDDRVAGIIEQVFVDNAEKLSGNPKVINWFVGQVIQQCKKQGIPLDVEEVKKNVAERFIANS